MTESFRGAQFPQVSPSKESWHWPTWTPILLTWLLVGVAPMFRTASITSTERLVGVAAATLALSIALESQFRRSVVRPWFVAGAVIIAVAVVSWLGGRTSGLLALLGAASALILLAARVRQRDDHDPVSPLSVGPALAFMVLAGRLGTSATTTLAPLVPAVVATFYSAQLLVNRPAIESLGRHLAQVGRRFLRGLVLTLTGLIGVLTLVPTWLIDRITGWDPLPRPGRGAGWVRRTDTPTLRMSTRQRGLVAIGGARRLHRAARRTAGTCVLIGVVLFAAVLTARQFVNVPNPGISSPAMASSPWYPDIQAVTDEMLVRQHFNSFLVYEMPEVTSSYLNVEDGRRRTWKPPAGACPAIDVWMFGGSTMFGAGQRDDHTIASELARLAWERGIRLDVTNFGAFGDTNWIASRRLEESLVTAHAAPQIVTFYDGYNELQTISDLNDRGRAGDNTAVSYVDSQLYPLIMGMNADLWSILRPSDRVSTYVEPPDVIADPEELGHLAAKQYRLGFEAAKRLLAGRDIDARWFYQPTIYSRSEPPPGEPDPDESNGQFTRRAFHAARNELPTDVVDLSGAFDGEPTPVFSDAVHTNERGAELVAKAMFDNLLPALTKHCEEVAMCC